ncbi:unnamed protein product [Phytophthora lilii]|uniref:Unnamed protein product n=1 Tax=Phytophthora lilii TaxID=2077276 RepID=A0A9W6XJ42_9STRA|nr:unnamed protein product [Phytophthora lilii]
MAQRRGRAAERQSPNPRPRQQSRTNAPDDDEASRPTPQNAASANSQAGSTAQATPSAAGPDTMSMQQLLPSPDANPAAGTDAAGQRKIRISSCV